MAYRLSHLDTLESEAIHIIREVVAEFERPALLFSGGKDSAVLLAPRCQGVLATDDPVPGRPRRHRPQLPRGDRVPRPAGRRAGRRASSSARCRRRSTAARSSRRPRPARPANRLQTHSLLKVHRRAPLRRRLRRRTARRGEGAGEGADLLLPRRVRPVGPPRPAAGAVEPLQRPPPPRRALQGLPALELDRARHLAVHRRGGTRAPRDLLRPQPRRSFAATGMLLAVGPYTSPRARATRSPSRRRSATAPSAT